MTTAATYTRVAEHFDPDMLAGEYAAYVAEWTDEWDGVAEPDDALLTFDAWLATEAGEHAYLDWLAAAIEGDL